MLCLIPISALLSLLSRTVARWFLLIPLRSHWLKSLSLSDNLFKSLHARRPRVRQPPWPLSELRGRYRRSLLLKTESGATKGRTWAILFTHSCVWAPWKVTLSIGRTTCTTCALKSPVPTISKWMPKAAPAIGSSASIKWWTPFAPTNTRERLGVGAWCRF